MVQGVVWMGFRWGVGRGAWVGAVAAGLLFLGGCREVKTRQNTTTQGGKRTQYHTDDNADSSKVKTRTNNNTSQQPNQHDGSTVKQE